MIDVKWYEEEKTSYNVDIEVYSNDRTGLLVDILKVIGTTKAKIMAVNTKTTKEKIKQLNKENKLIYEKLDPHINMYRWLAKKVHKKNIWLYYDSANVYDNGYYQFLHDLEKKDGINRYYIYDKMNEKLKEKFTPKQRRHLLKYGSLKHRLYFLNSDKIISSDISLSVYCPFRKSIKWYRDIINYELIYLQHGILYANLLQMYGKEFNEIDKIVISSEFEKKNLVEN